eukprot:1157975-Pelagomonas_calceolata.AAC.10
MCEKESKGAAVQKNSTARLASECHVAKKKQRVSVNLPRNNLTQSGMCPKAERALQRRMCRPKHSVPLPSEHAEGQPPAEKPMLEYHPVGKAL